MGGGDSEEEDETQPLGFGSAGKVTNSVLGSPRSMKLSRKRVLEVVVDSSNDESGLQQPRGRKTFINRGKGNVGKIMKMSKKKPNKISSPRKKSGEERKKATPKKKVTTRNTRNKVKKGRKNNESE